MSGGASSVSSQEIRGYAAALRPASPATRFHGGGIDRPVGRRGRGEPKRRESPIDNDVPLLAVDGAWQIADGEPFIFPPNVRKYRK